MQLSEVPRHRRKCDHSSKTSNTTFVHSLTDTIPHSQLAPGVGMCIAIDLP